MAKYRRKYLDYKDFYITIFNDDDKLALVFLNDIGDTQSINYDDNMFYIEYLIDTYLEMITKSFKGWRDKELTDSDKKEIKTHLQKYVNHLKRHTEIDYEACDSAVLEMLGVKL